MRSVNGSASDGSDRAATPPLSILFQGDKRLDSRQSMPESLARDLNLDRLLPAETIQLLLFHTTPDEASARRDYFRFMEREGRLSDAMKSLSDALATLSQLKHAYETDEFPKSELENLILLRTRCDAWLTAYERAKRLCTLHPYNDPSAMNPSGDATAAKTAPCLPLEQLNAHLEALSDLNAELAEAIRATADCLGQLSESSARLNEGNIINVAKPGTENLTARLRELIAGFGCTLHSRPKKALRISVALSDTLTKLHPQTVADLRVLQTRFEHRLDSFEGLRRELEFYLDLHALSKRGRAAGFPLCYPKPANEKAFRATEACDFTLLLKFGTNNPTVETGSAGIGAASNRVVPNDIDFDKASDVCFLTGANGGGKTTYLRCVASNLLLALAGCPIFAETAEVGGIDHLCTHFPADETFTSSGRLIEEAARVDAMLADCGSGSFIFMNETYSGTDDIKGAKLTLEAAQRIREIGAYSLWVTHFHEVADKGYPMLTTVVDEMDTAKRTFRVVKRRGDGSSYAADILRKYNLDAASLAERRRSDAEHSLAEGV